MGSGCIDAAVRIQVSHRIICLVTSLASRNVISPTSPATAARWTVTFREARSLGRLLDAICMSGNRLEGVDLSLRRKFGQGQRVVAVVSADVEANVVLARPVPRRIAMICCS